MVDLSNAVEIVFMPILLSGFVHSYLINILDSTWKLLRIKQWFSWSESNHHYLSLVWGYCRLVLRLGNRFDFSFASRSQNRIPPRYVYKKSLYLLGVFVQEFSYEQSNESVRMRVGASDSPLLGMSLQI